MTKDRDQDAFIREFLKKLSAKAPLHEWREVLTPSNHYEGTTVIAAVGRGAIWLGVSTPFDRPTARVIRRELQEIIDAARALRGENINDKSC